MKHYFIKTLGGLKPIDECKAYNKLKLGEQTEIDIKTPRNIQFHKKFFSLINLCFDNQSDYSSLDHLRKDLIKDAGYYHQNTNYITGEVTIEADSISFSSMDEVEFSKLYNDVLNSICEYLGTSDKELLDELLHY